MRFSVLILNPSFVSSVKYKETFHLEVKRDAKFSQRNHTETHTQNLDTMALLVPILLSLVMSFSEGTPSPSPQEQQTFDYEDFLISLKQLGEYDAQERTKTKTYEYRF